MMGGGIVDADELNALVDSTLDKLEAVRALLDNLTLSSVAVSFRPFPKRRGARGRKTAIVWAWRPLSK